MLTKKEIMKQIDKKYEDMLNQIDTANFYKCIAQFSGLNIQNVSNNVVIQYLKTWCENKYHFFKLMKNNLKVDIPFHYIDENIDIREKYIEVGQDFPTYYPWCYAFKNLIDNKINARDLNYDAMRLISNAFKDNIKYDGMAITRFFKQHLNAPDELITKIAAIYENRDIDATFTISIDPVDIMLSSENPYGWTSCYRLESGDFCESHADGCLAAVLDKVSLITYVWTNHGKFSLYSHYEFKDIRYKRMRMTIAVANDFKLIHFNQIYPGKSSYSDDLKKKFRDVVENFFSQAANFRNMWKTTSNINIFRDLEYGYGEYQGSRIWIQSDSSYDRSYQHIAVFTEPILCPCGCGNILPGTDTENEEYNYNGDGHIYENYMPTHYCEYVGDYINCDEDCEHCYDYCISEPRCSENTDIHCNRDLDLAEEEGDFNPYKNNIVQCNPKHCKNCPLYAQHHTAIDELDEA